MTRSDPTERLLRPAGTGDVPALVRVHVDAREHAAPAMPPPAHPVDELREHLLGAVDPTRKRPDDEVWVAEQGERVLGYLRLAAGWLEDLYVRPDVQRRGVGGDLLGLARARRPDGFSLWVFESNHPARRFYRRHGLWELEWSDGADNDERAPEVRMAWPGEDPVAYLRAQVDEVDEDLARALARRAALTRVIQQHKPVAGEAGRDPRREREIARRMAAHARELGEERLARIVHGVITESLAAAEDARGRGGADGS